MAALPDTSPRLRAALGKWPGLFARLCLTFHLIDLADTVLTGAARPHMDVVPEGTARRVATFMRDIVAPHLLRAEVVMFSTVQTGHAQWIAGHILAHRLDRITSRDIVRAYRDLRAPEARAELDAVMASLTTIGWLEPELPSNSVKPVSAWIVNPAVHIAFEARAQRERALRERTRADLAADAECCAGRGRAQRDLVVAIVASPLPGDHADAPRMCRHRQRGFWPYWRLWRRFRLHPEPPAENLSTLSLARASRRRSAPCF